MTKAKKSKKPSGYDQEILQQVTDHSTNSMKGYSYIENSKKKTRKCLFSKDKNIISEDSEQKQVNI